jgi:glycosyltransferase involved in cell wall biosynthesis
MSPRVSIGLPVYNGERFLPTALDSILAQTYTDFEIVISDNGSSDSTQAICQRYAAQDERVKYHRSEQNRGGTWNFNRVVELSRGEFFRWAAHDDVIAPTYLERCVAVLDANPDVVLAHTRVEIIDEHGVSSGVYDAPAMRLDDDRAHVRFHDVTTYHGRCHLIFGVVRRGALGRIPAYGAYGHADGVLLARLIMLGKFVQLDEPLQLMREHDDQASTTYGVKGGLDYLAWRAWFDPKYADALGFPYWRIVGEYARSLVVVKGVSLIERGRCLQGVWAAAWTTKGRMKQDLIRAGRILAGRVRGRRNSVTPGPGQ